MNEISFFPALLKMLLALAIVIGLMVLAMYVMKRYLHPPSLSRGGDLIQILSSRYIGPKCSIMLVEVLGTIIVLGVSSGQMTALATIADHQAVEIIKSVREHEPLKPDLADRLKQYTDKFMAMGLEQKAGRRR